MSLAQTILRQDDEKPNLPPASAAKLEALRIKRDECFARSRAIIEKVRDASNIRASLESERSKWVGYDGPIDMRARKEAITECDLALDRHAITIRELNEKERAIAAENAEAGAALQTIETWLEDNRGADFRPYAAVKPKLKSSENWDITVDRIRSAIAELRADQHRVASAPIPAAEAKATIKREIEAIAQFGAPDVEAALEGGQIRWPQTVLTRSDGIILSHQITDVHALFVWLHRDELISRLCSDVDAIADPAAAMTAEQRRKEQARLETEIMRTEREEEAVIAAAALQGVIISRRPNADPRAVLELADNVPGLVSE